MRTAPWVLVVLLSAGALQAQPAPDEASRLREARALFTRGLAHHDHGEVDLAIADFEAAWALSPRPSVLLNLGLEYQRAGRLLEALDALERFNALPDAPRRQLRVASRAAEAVRLQLAELTLSTDPPGAAVTLDGRAVNLTGPLRLQAGPHALVATLPGREEARRSLTLAPGERLSLVLTLPLEVAPPPPPPPPPPPDYALTVAGLPPGARATADDRPLEGSARVAPGEHRVTLSAPGYLSWTGVVRVTRPVTLRASLARVPEPRATAPGWALTLGAGVAALAAAGLGVAALVTHDAFSELTREDPQARVLSSRGEALSLTADLTALVALGLGATAGWWWLRPAPPASPSRAEVEP